MAAPSASTVAMPNNGKMAPKSSTRAPLTGIGTERPGAVDSRPSGKRRAAWLRMWTSLAKKVVTAASGPEVETPMSAMVPA